MSTYSRTTGMGTDAVHLAVPLDLLFELRPKIVRKVAAGGWGYDVLRVTQKCYAREVDSVVDLLSGGVCGSDQSAMLGHNLEAVFYKVWCDADKQPHAMPQAGKYVITLMGTQGRGRESKKQEA